MLKEVTLEEALRAGREGVSPMVILTVPGRKACFRLPLYELLSTCIFLVDDNPEQRPEIPPPRRKYGARNRAAGSAVAAEKGTETEAGRHRQNNGASQCRVE